MDTSAESPADFLVGQRFPYVSLVAATGVILERDDFALRVRRRAAPCAQHLVVVAGHIIHANLGIPDADAHPRRLLTQLRPDP
jgi:hypothetical protein